MKKTYLVLFFLLLVPQQGSALYVESASLFTADGSEYYYTYASSYSHYYLGEILDIDVELIVDYFSIDSYSIYDIDIFLRGENYDGFTVFERSHQSSLDIAFDGEGIVVEWDIPITDDFPDILYILVAADFYEETVYGDVFYSDDWIELTSISIYEGNRRASMPVLPFLGAIIFLAVTVKRRRLIA